MATSLLKQALDARGLRKSDLCGVDGLCYSLARRHYMGERSIGAKYAILYETLLGIPRSELRPDLWPPPDNTQHQEAVHEKPATSSC